MTILDLCSGSGAWSQPYVDGGYEVIRIDLPTDVRLYERPGRPIQGILAAPPCTVFARSGLQWKRSAEDMRQGLSVVDACLRLVFACKPKWWALENPVGILRRWLGPPVCYFNPCEYGDPWTKKTCLWGRFTMPEKTPVEPLRSYSQSCTKSKRAITPPGFAKAFFAANE